VTGIGKVLRLQAGLVAPGADLRALRRTEGLEADDFGGIAAAVNVGLSGTVAALTSVLVALQQRGVRSAGKVLLPQLLMAGLANAGLSVLAASRSRQSGRTLRRLIARMLLRRNWEMQATRQ